MKSDAFLSTNISISLFGNNYKQTTNHATETNHIRTAFISFPGHLKQPCGFLVRCHDKEQRQKEKKEGSKSRLNSAFQ